MKKRPLLSIVIPTKNRFQYLKEIIRVLLLMESDDVEFVIQDNSDANKNILPFLEEINDDRIKYFYSEGDLSVVDNSNLAIERGIGKFVCCIGDDDIVSKHIVNVVRWMDLNNIDSCIGAQAKFFWSDIVFKRHKFYSLSVSKNKSKVRYVDPSKELNKCLRHGAISLENMPKVYHAIVSRKSLDKLKNITGTFFPGPSPDMANAVGLCFTVDRHCLINIPIVISGHSYKSAGGMGTRGMHVGDLKSIPWLPKNIVEIWKEKVPQVWTANTIYAVSALCALESINKGMLEKFNYQFHYAGFVNYNSALKGELFKNKRKYPINYLKFACYFLYITLGRGRNFIKNFMETRFSVSENILFNNVVTIEDAFNEVNGLSYEEL